VIAFLDVQHEKDKNASATERIKCAVTYIPVPEGPVNDGYTLGKKKLNVSITGPP
jgi:hypothetical protein